MIIGVVEWKVWNNSWVLFRKIKDFKQETGVLSKSKGFQLQK